MNIQPKIEPGSPSTNQLILDTDEDEVGSDPIDLEGMSIPNLVQVLLGSLQTQTYHTVEAILVRRDLALRQENQQFQQNFEMERHSRLQAQEEFKKRDEICQKVQESHDNLLKEAKMAEKTHNKTIDFLRNRNIGLKCEVNKLNKKRVEEDHEVDVLRKKKLELECEVNQLKEERVEKGHELEKLRKKNGELECEVNKLNEEKVEDENEFEVLRKKNDELECDVNKLKEKRVEDGNVLEVLRKQKAELENEVLELKAKRVEDENALDALKTKKSELESEVLELRKLKEKWEEDRNELENKACELEKLKETWLEDSNALAELQRKVGELEETVTKKLATISKLKTENSKLADEKRKADSLLESLNTKFRGLHERVARLEDDSKILMSVRGGNDEVEPPADAMVTDLEDQDKEDVGDNEFRSDTVEEAAPLQINEDDHHSQGVAAGTQPQNKGSKDASSDSESEVKGVSLANGRLKMEKHIEILNFDDEDDNQCASRGVHEKKAISGIAGKYEHPTPSSSTAVQQMSKFANEVDKVKRKYSLTCSESSTSTSSDDLLYLDHLTIRSVVSQGKKKKM